ncbi:MAG: hypothetical protein HQK55_10915 [Deltaproteobacteria bacterium]|nr:hypothetical protein [Deltaproteobacteria bacterium]
MQKGKNRIKAIMAELTALTGRNYGGLIEAYKTEDADVILVAIGSVVGTIKDAVDELREAGKKVGLIKIICYRPFPHEDILEAIKNSKAVVVLDANISLGSEGAIGMDLKAKLCGQPKAPLILDLIAGLGGREINIKTVGRIVEEAEKALLSGSPWSEARWLDLDPTILP